ncbi:DsbA family protein [Nocardia speluncae]|uniref:DsbA family protein n=1 Tax=Nocardia speluncae TaxID=419477 RepID=UPI000834601B
MLAVLITAAAITAARSNDDEAPQGEPGAAPASAARADSHRLSTAPDGRVTFVVRYFPIPSHFNSERAARAVEAAAQQGRFEQMYQRMFEIQAGWGEATTTSLQPRRRARPTGPPTTDGSVVGVDVAAAYAEVLDAFAARVQAGFGGAR